MKISKIKKLKTNLKLAYLKYKKEFCTAILNCCVYISNIIMIRAIFRQSVYLVKMLNVLIVFMCAAPMLVFIQPRTKSTFITGFCAVVFFLVLLLNGLLFTFRNQVFWIYCTGQNNAVKIISKCIKRSSVILLYGPFSRKCYDLCMDEDIFKNFSNCQLQQKDLDKFNKMLQHNQFANVTGILYRYITVVNTNEIDTLPDKITDTIS
ncbi:hypothetical protein ECANGB1_1486 [Enterospora canceri]|uniref:Uncharacterized protein n=1 Tax=Enterospora canceri TaxID=1081671 RepID=A0A1Y1S5X3_9MICR|nr:hypothetical protein ECANGB1_1486 [Enterospora canceri]